VAEEHPPYEVGRSGRFRTRTLNCLCIWLKVILRWMVLPVRAKISNRGQGIYRVATTYCESFISRNLERTRILLHVEVGADTHGYRVFGICAMNNEGP
jgi:hypothetical protein